MVSEKIEEIVGSEHLEETEEKLEEYSKDHSFVPARTPSAVVKPGNSEEVQELIKLANTEEIPIVPVSSGSPHFKGDTVPRFGGMVIDLSRMNKIKMIKRSERVAMVEPGIRFNELQEELKENGLRLPTPLSPRKTKSVVGAFLEREPPIMPKYHIDHSDPLLCNEVYFGNGEKFRTGEAGGYGSIEKQRKMGRYQKFRMGVQMTLTRLLQGAQGTLGIATWSTLKCEVLPQVQKPFLAPAQNLNDLLKFERELVVRRIADAVFILNDSNLAALVGREKNIEKIKESLPPWILFFNLSGFNHLPEERVEYQEKDVKDIASPLGIKLSEEVRGISANNLLETATTASNGSYWKIKESGSCQDIYFISPFEKIPKLIETMMELIGGEKNYSASKLGIYLQHVSQGHGYHCEFRLPYDPSDEKEAEAVKNIYVEGSKALMDRGAFISRPYGSQSEMVFNRDAATKDKLMRMKEIFDPANVMNPGKLCF